MAFGQSAFGEAWTESFRFLSVTESFGFRPAHCQAESMPTQGAADCELLDVFADLLAYTVWTKTPDWLRLVACVIPAVLRNYEEKVSPTV